MANSGLLRRLDDGSFTPGPLLARTGTLALGGGDLSYEVLTQALRQLTITTRLTAVRSVWNELAPVVVQTEEADTPAHVTVRVGTRLPLTAAQTLVFMAFTRDASLVERMLALVADPERETLQAQIRTIVDQGIFIGGRVTSGVRTIAAPVLGPDGTIVMSVALVGTEGSVPTALGSRETRDLAAVVADLSARLGYRGPHPALSYLDTVVLRVV
jgi:DNA-binding IclR family transcriptional regulator